MKQSFVLSLLAFAFSATTSAQSLVGKWAGEFPGQNDQPALKFTLTITENTYQFDMGMDGKVDVTGSYTSDGKQITIWDTAGENTCPPDQKGVYAFTLDGNTATFTKVSDACAGRGDAPLVVKRM
ncbi:MAG: hypothetical protein DYG98_06765 [Haliscomenobacteraceae bacterium CHB4]|nr:hypothetical protein [Haliscomenobacteraceae bacterium CHB4]